MTDQLTDYTDRLTDEFLDETSDMFALYLKNFPEERGTFSILSKQFEQRDRQLCNRTNMTGHLTASGLLLHPENNSVFLIHHNFLNLWLQPGGHLDPGENPRTGALREFIEETGIKDVELHPWHVKHSFPFDMDTHAIPANQKKNEGSHFHHDFQYLLAFPHSEAKRCDESLVNIAQDEVSNFRWITLTELMEGDFDVRLKRAADKIVKLVL